MPTTRSPILHSDHNTHELTELKQQYLHAAEEAVYAGNPSIRRYARKVKHEIAQQIRALGASRRADSQQAEQWMLEQGIAFHRPPKKDVG